MPSKHTLKTLEKGTEKVLPTAVRNAGVVRFTQITETSDPGIGLRFQGLVTGSKGEKYAPIVVFSVRKKPTSKSKRRGLPAGAGTLRKRPSLGLGGGLGEDPARSVATPSRAKTPVRVRCDCLAYRHYFSFQNQKADCQWGEDFPPYVRKTQDFVRYPKKNPDNIPGICKHLYLLANRLISEGSIDN